MGEGDGTGRPGSKDGLAAKTDRLWIGTVRYSSLPTVSFRGSRQYIKEVKCVAPSVWVGRKLDCSVRLYVIRRTRKDAA